MSNLSELIGLYGLSTLPRDLQKERELKRWREIMRYEQDDLPGYLKAEAETREASIPERASFEHKRRMAMRWFKYYKMCRDPKKKQELVRQYNLIATMKQR